jgi:hypothetical protein
MNLKIVFLNDDLSIIREDPLVGPYEVKGDCVKGAIGEYNGIKTKFIILDSEYVGEITQEMYDSFVEEITKPALTPEQQEIERLKEENAALLSRISATEDAILFLIMNNPSSMMAFSSDSSLSL